MKLPRLMLAAVAMALSGAFCETAWADGQSWEEIGNPHEMLSFEKVKVPRWIAETVIRAAEVTGVDPAFVMALADKESSFDPQSKAPTSSAEGLFQFVEGTWLEVLSAHAAKHGFGAAAQAITSLNGRPTVEDAETKRWILSLRQDPYLSALMACEMVKQSQGRLVQQTSRVPTTGELYLAHFLGANGASRLLKLLVSTPGEKAPKVFPRAAKANRTIFAGSSKNKEATLAEVHARVSAMIEVRVGRFSSVSTKSDVGHTAVTRHLQVSSAGPL
jgi:hypothetical protein